MNFKKNHMNKMKQIIELNLNNIFLLNRRKINQKRLFKIKILINFTKYLKNSNKKTRKKEIML